MLTRKALDALCVADNQLPNPREQALAASSAQFPSVGKLPAEFTERFALDHDLRPTILSRLYIYACKQVSEAV